MRVVRCRLLTHSAVTSQRHALAPRQSCISSKHNSNSRHRFLVRVFGFGFYVPSVVCLGPIRLCPAQNNQKGVRATTAKSGIFLVWVFCRRPQGSCLIKSHVRGRDGSRIAVSSRARDSGATPCRSSSRKPISPVSALLSSPSSCSLCFASRSLSEARKLSNAG